MSGMLGRTVGNYRVTHELGEGGMGTVYAAEHEIGRRVAIKVLRPAVATDPEAVQRFFNEARAANAIRHPGIVQIYDFGRLPEQTCYIVMELLEGESLAARLAYRSPLPLAEAVAIVCDAAETLAAAHAAGIVHRDLKPENMFLVEDPRRPGGCQVKILDFGIAKLDQTLRGSSPSLTQTKAILGTPRYMSPEQCRSARRVDQRSDIYSLGVILYEMVCAVPPFSAEGTGELLSMHIGQAPPPPRTVNADLPAAIEDVLLKALAKQPAQRFQNMRELEGALRLALGPPALALPGPAPRRRESHRTELADAVASAQITSPAPRRKGRAGLALGGAVALGLVALTVHGARRYFAGKTVVVNNELARGASEGAIALERLWSAGGKQERVTLEDQGHADRGHRAMAAGRYDQAIRELQLAYDASHEAALLYDIALCHRWQKQQEEALKAFKHFLTQATAQDPRRPLALQGVIQLQAELRQSATR
jgi:predicted Ser/Thr protein kinase